LESSAVRPLSLNWSREKDLSQYLSVYSSARAMIDSMDAPALWSAPGELLERRLVEEADRRRRRAAGSKARFRRDGEREGRRSRERKRWRG
jgi:hypothetical protein